MSVNEIKQASQERKQIKRKGHGQEWFQWFGTVNGLDDDYLKHFLLPYHHPPTFVHNYIYGYIWGHLIMHYEHPSYNAKKHGGSINPNIVNPNISMLLIEQQQNQCRNGEGWCVKCGGAGWIRCCWTERMPNSLCSTSPPSPLSR